MGTYFHNCLSALQISVCALYQDNQNQDKGEIKIINNCKEFDIYLEKIWKGIRNSKVTSNPPQNKTNQNFQAQKNEQANKLEEKPNYQNKNIKSLKLLNKKKTYLVLEYEGLILLKTNSSLN